MSGRLRITTRPQQAQRRHDTSMTAARRLTRVCAGATSEWRTYLQQQGGGPGSSPLSQILSLPLPFTLPLSMSMSLPLPLPLT